MKTHQSTRFLNLKDLFTITCNKCGSTDVDIHAEECHECGVCISGECNNCGNKYDYHDFKQIKVWYDEKGKEVRKELENDKDTEKVC